MRDSTPTVHNNSSPARVHKQGYHVTIGRNWAFKEMEVVIEWGNICVSIESGHSEVDTVRSNRKGGHMCL